MYPLTFDTGLQLTVRIECDDILADSPVGGDEATIYSVDKAHTFTIKSIYIL